jgi:hypothetical protein
MSLGWMFMNFLEAIHVPNGRQLNFFVISSRNGPLGSATTSDFPEMLHDALSMMIRQQVLQQVQQ